jgi:hypothetical protein
VERNRLFKRTAKRKVSLQLAQSRGKERGRKGERTDDALEFLDQTRERTQEVFFLVDRSLAAAGLLPFSFPTVLRRLVRRPRETATRKVESAGIGVPIEKVKE